MCVSCVHEVGPVGRTSTPLQPPCNSLIVNGGSLEDVGALSVHTGDFTTVRVNYEAPEVFCVCLCSFGDHITLASKRGIASLHERSLHRVTLLSTNV